MHTITRHTRAPAARRAAAAPVAPPSPRRALFRRPAQAGQPHGQPQQQPKGEERRLGWAEQDLATGLEFRPAEAVKDTLSDLFNREKQVQGRSGCIARFKCVDGLKWVDGRRTMPVPRYHGASRRLYNVSHAHESLFLCVYRSSVQANGLISIPSTSLVHGASLLAVGDQLTPDSVNTAFIFESI